MNFYIPLNADCTTFYLTDRKSITELMNELNTFSNLFRSKTWQDRMWNCGCWCSEWDSSGILWY